MAAAFDSGSFESTAFEVGGGGATNYTLTCNAGSFTLSGVSANVLRSKRIVSTAGSYSQTGVSANLLRSKRIVSNAGSYAQTGVSANLYRNRKLTATAGAYSVAGQNAILTYTPTAVNYTLTAQEGSFAITGVSATLMRSKLVTASAGSYAASGVSAAIKLGKVLTAQAGSYTLTGLAADIGYSGGPAPPVGYELTCLAGSYTMGGDFVDDGYVEPGYAGNAVITIGIASYSQEVELNPGKWYVRRGRKLHIFNKAQDADNFIEAEEAAQKVVEQAQKTSRLARKRLRQKVFAVDALPQQTIDTDWLAQLVSLYSIPVDLPNLIDQQDYERVVQIMLLAREMQEEEEVEMLLLM